MANHNDPKNATEIPQDDANHHGDPHPTHATAAEQTREAQEAKQALNDQASIRDKMVNIGRGNQQAGRQGQ